MVWFIAAGITLVGLFFGLIIPTAADGYSALVEPEPGDKASGKGDGADPEKAESFLTPADFEA